MTSGETCLRLFFKSIADGNIMEDDICVHG